MDGDMRFVILIPWIRNFYDALANRKQAGVKLRGKLSVIKQKPSYIDDIGKKSVSSETNPHYHFHRVRVHKVHLFSWINLKHIYFLS